MKKTKSEKQIKLDRLHSMYRRFKKQGEVRSVLRVKALIYCARSQIAVLRKRN